MEQKKFNSQAEAIACIEKMMAEYATADPIRKGTILVEMGNLKKELPQEFNKAHELLQRYVDMSPEKAMERAEELCSKIEKAEFNPPLKAQARQMLAEMPKTPEYTGVCDLLRHYAE